MTIHEMSKILLFFILNIRNLSNITHVNFNDRILSQICKSLRGRLFNFRANLVGKVRISKTMSKYFRDERILTLTRQTYVSCQFSPDSREGMIKYNEPTQYFKISVPTRKATIKYVRHRTEFQRGISRFATTVLDQNGRYIQTKTNKRQVGSYTRNFNILQKYLCRRF